MESLAAQAPAKTKATAKALVIGGRSRIASALCRLYPDAYHFAVRSKPGRELSSAELTVPTYEAISADDMKGYSTVINLVGTTEGSADQLMMVNGQLPSHLASEAVRAGVSHFVTLSSFSIYGHATIINHDTPILPRSDYGRSRVVGESNVARHANALACTLARCPMLYGTGDSKLEQLVALWCRIGALPTPARPIYRSMVHYDLAARYLDEIACSNRNQPGLTIDHFADPVAFEYRMAANAISKAIRKQKRAISLPAICFRLFAAVSPEMSRSLFSDSVLSATDNYFEDPQVSRLERDIEEMASQLRGDA